MSYTLGEIVDCQFEDDSPDFYRGVIKRIYRDGTFYILFDDGDERKDATTENLKKVISNQNEVENNDRSESLPGNGSMDDLPTNNSDITEKTVSIIKIPENQSSNDGKQDLNQDGEGKRAESTNSEAVISYNIGEVVDCHYYDNNIDYFRGRIENINADGTYFVLFEDGDTMEDAAIEHLKKVASDTLKGLDNNGAPHPSEELPHEQPQPDPVERTDSGSSNSVFAVGATVECQCFDDDPDYFKACVLKVNSDGTYLVRFEDDEEKDHVLEQQIRNIIHQASSDKSQLLSSETTDNGSELIRPEPVIDQCDNQEGKEIEPVEGEVNPEKAQKEDMIVQTSQNPLLATADKIEVPNKNENIKKDLSLVPIVDTLNDSQPTSGQIQPLMSSFEKSKLIRILRIEARDVRWNNDPRMKVSIGSKWSRQTNNQCGRGTHPVWDLSTHSDSVAESDWELEVLEKDLARTVMCLLLYDIKLIGTGEKSLATILASNEHNICASNASGQTLMTTTVELLDKLNVRVGTAIVNFSVNDSSRSTALKSAPEQQTSDNSILDDTANESHVNKCTDGQPGSARVRFSPEPPKTAECLITPAPTQNSMLPLPISDTSPVVSSPAVEGEKHVISNIETGKILKPELQESAQRVSSLSTPNYELELENRVIKANLTKSVQDIRSLEQQNLQLIEVNHVWANKCFEQELLIQTLQTKISELAAESVPKKEKEAVEKQLAEAVRANETLVVDFDVERKTWVIQLKQRVLEHKKDLDLQLQVRMGQYAELEDKCRSKLVESDFQIKALSTSVDDLKRTLEASRQTVIESEKHLQQVYDSRDELLHNFEIHLLEWQSFVDNQIAETRKQIHSAIQKFCYEWPVEKIESKIALEEYSKKLLTLVDKTGTQIDPCPSFDVDILRRSYADYSFYDHTRSPRQSQRHLHQGNHIAVTRSLAKSNSGLDGDKMTTHAPRKNGVSLREKAEGPSEWMQEPNSPDQQDMPSLSYVTSGVDQEDAAEREMEQRERRPRQVQRVVNKEAYPNAQYYGGKRPGSYRERDDCSKTSSLGSGGSVFNGRRTASREDHQRNKNIFR